MEIKKMLLNWLDRTPRKVINKLSADYHVKPHHTAFINMIKAKKIEFIQSSSTFYKVQNVFYKFIPKNFDSDLIIPLWYWKLNITIVIWFFFLARTTWPSNHVTSFNISCIKHNVYLFTLDLKIGKIKNWCVHFIIGCF